NIYTTVQVSCEYGRVISSDGVQTLTDLVYNISWAFFDVYETPKDIDRDIFNSVSGCPFGFV
ncbi:hypothetical protein L9F63_019399, partial [Diploptera punctata]